MIRKNLILSDIDGTFLGKKSRLVPENVSAIERFKSEGGLFAFASGRSEITIHSVVPEAGKIANAPCILTNGSYIYDFAEKKVYFHTPMDGELARDVLKEMAARFPDVAIRINRKDHFLSYRVNDKLKLDLAGYITEAKIMPFDEMPTDGWNKAIMRGDADSLIIARKWIEENYPGRFHISLSASSMLELLHPEATKGIMVGHLRELFASRGVDVRIYAIGDYENDLELLAASDIPVCPSNAMDKVQAICKKVLCHHDEGAVADLIGQIEKGIL